MPGALGWFQKYQKSLMLVLLAPALIGMGITGAIMSVVQSPGEMVVAEVFGEPVTQTEYSEVIQPYLTLTGQGGGEESEDQAFRFLAMWLAARRSGLSVSDAEVGKDIWQEAKYLVAQNKALEDVQKAQLPAGADAAEKMFRERFLHYLLDEEFTVTAEEYQDVIRKRQGMPIKVYEAHQKREALVQRYLETLRELATVTPAEVREAYEEKHHQRVLELIELGADAYAPRAGAPEGEPGHVTEAQVKAYYEERAADFDIPRKVALAYVAAPLKKVEDALALPDDAALQAYNEAQGIAPVGSFNDARMEIIDAWRADATREKVAELMDAVADRVEAAEKAGETPDLTKIAAEVDGELLERGTTGLIEVEALKEQRLLRGPAARRWHQTTEETGATSDVLASEAAWYVVQTQEVQHKRTPEYSAIEDQVRQAYVDGSPKELREYYDQYKGTRYRDKPSYELEAVTAKDAAFGDDRQRARDALKQALDAAKDWHRQDRNFSVWKFQSNTDLPQDVQDKLEILDDLELATDALKEHPIVGPAEGEIGTRVSRGFSDYPIRSRDDTAWFGYRALRRKMAETKPFEEVEAEVRRDVQRERALQRAEEAAQELLEELAGKRGEALEKALQAKGLKPRRTEPVGRDATSLEGIEDAGRLVAEAFSAEAEVGGPYLRTVPDFAGRRVFLVRVAEKVAAPEEDWAEEYTTIRKDLLSKKRMDFAERQIDTLILRAKGISEEHLAFVDEATSGANGISKVTLRQVFLPPDREITDRWLEEQARARLAEAQQALAQGSSFEAVVDKFSEDDATRSRGGELPALTRQELTSEFGLDFAERVFALPVAEGQGGASEPIESTRGLHLVRKSSQQGGKVTLQHLLVRTDPQTRNMPEEVRQKAEQASREKLEKALAELEAGGKPFGVVAEAYGDPIDPNGRGQTFDLQVATAVERAAFAQPLEWEPAGDVLVNEPAWIPEPVQVELPGGQTWQLFACERDPADQAAVWQETGGVRNRLVYHIQTSSPQRMESVRAELAEWMREQVEAEGRPMFQRILEKFQELVVEYSEAPTKGKAGALGRMALRDSVRPYGAEFLEQVFAKEPRPGARTGVFRSAKGFHLVEVVDVVAEQDKERRQAVARSLLAGTDWRK